MIKCALPAYLIRLLTHTSSVDPSWFRVGIELSDSKLLNPGAPQGSLVSPIYSHYTCLTNSSLTLNLSWRCMSMPLLYSSSKSPPLAIKYMQPYLNLFECWLTMWKVTVNPLKSHAMLISKKESKEY
jgi:hypothetical protein